MEWKSSPLDKARKFQSKFTVAVPHQIQGPSTHEFGCDVKVNTDTRLVVAFPESSVLTPDLALGQPGQVARFEFSTTTKKNAHHHGRRADVMFVA